MTNEITVGQQIVQMSSEQIAQQLVSLYKSFDKNRKKISQKIDAFIKQAEIKNAWIVHASNANYTLLNPEIDYFIKGHALINEIRTLLGQEEVLFNIGILDQINNTFEQIQMDEKEAAKFMRTRGNDKIALAHSQMAVDLLRQYENKLNEESLTKKFFNFLSVLEKKTLEKGDDLNYGYAFEAFGHFNFQNGKFKGTRHETYYNYYKATRKNLSAWTTGGDLNNLQYKLIRIYKDDQGKKQISSASITSAETILTELNLIKEILDSNSTFPPNEIALKLAKEFTQLNIPTKINKELEENIQKVFIKQGIKII